MADVPEHCAGAVLMRGGPRNPELLLIRVRARVLELPKGHVEADETPEQAASRELGEETGLENPPAAGPLLSSVSYHFDGPTKVLKEVAFFLFAAEEELRFGPLPRPGRELRWIRRTDVDTVPLKSENLRLILRKAFDTYAG